MSNVSNLMMIYPSILQAQTYKVDLALYIYKTFFFGQEYIHFLHPTFAISF